MEERIELLKIIGKQRLNVYESLSGLILDCKNLQGKHINGTKTTFQID